MGEDPQARRAVIRARKEADRADREEPPTPDDGPDRARLDIRSIGLAIAVLGGALAAFGPLLRWWTQTLPNSGIAVATVGGLGAWTGFVALAGGIVTLSLGALASSGPEPNARIAYGMLAAGAATFAAALLSLTSGQRILGSELPVKAEPGLYLTIVGGLLAVIGGYLQTREGHS